MINPLTNFICATYNTVSWGMRAGYTFTKQHPKLMLGLALTACMTGVAAAAPEEFRISFFATPETTTLCLVSGAKRTAFRLYSFASASGLNGILERYNEFLNCNIANVAEASNEAIINCLKKGQGTFKVPAVDFAKACMTKAPSMVFSRPEL